MWNEHVPRLPPDGPDLRWAVQGQRRLVASLRALARQMGRDPRLAGVQAVCGITVLFFPGEGSGGEKLFKRLGFTLYPCHNPLGRFGEFLRMSIHGVSCGPSMRSVCGNDACCACAAASSGCSQTGSCGDMENMKRNQPSMPDLEYDLAPILPLQKAGAFVIMRVAEGEISPGIAHLAPCNLHLASCILHLAPGV